jgi:hypothetical protein
MPCLYEAMQQQLAKMYGPVALYKIRWADETMYLCPSSLAKMIDEVNSSSRDFLETEYKGYIS